MNPTRLLFASLVLLLALVAASTPIARAAPPSPTTIPVVFVPGIGGTRLADSTNAEYWPAAGYPDHDDLTLYPNTSHPTLYPTNAITEATFLGVHIAFEDWQTYGPLFSYFRSQGFVQYQTYQDPTYQTSAGCDLTQAPAHPNLFVFAYDWRISNAANATLLADYIACVQKFYPNTNVNLVAHSMGGLVSRRYILDHPGASHVNALISVASPYIGAGKVVWTEETGDYVFFIWASTILNVVGSFNGASELLPSQAWYNIGGPPVLVEDGQDLNHDGNYDEQFTYPMLVQYMDAAKGQQGFLPGTANKTFHSYTNANNAQDDWSHDTTGVQYFHIVGAGGAADTIQSVVAASFLKCLKHFTICNLSTWMYPQFAQGDTTVSLLASSRIGPNGNLNAPHATLYTCQALGANNQNVDHTGMLSNPVVQGLLLQYLAQANGATPQPPPDPGVCGDGGGARPGAAARAYHRLTLSGVQNVQVSDGTADPVTDGAAMYRASADSVVLMLAADKTYTVSFEATGDPLYAEWLNYAKKRAPARAMRLLDAQLPAGARARFTVERDRISSLAFDSNGDTLLDANVGPTIELKGKPAHDVQPPVVTLASIATRTGRRVTLSASDVGLGVDTIVYSLDGIHFQLYQRPFQVSADTLTVYAFAQDKAGNRSGLITLAVPAQ